jgi:hypothetical protein
MSLSSLRRTASWLSEFRPFLVGPVLSFANSLDGFGSQDPADDVVLTVRRCLAKLAHSARAISHPKWFCFPRLQLLITTTWNGFEPWDACEYIDSLDYPAILPPVPPDLDSDSRAKILVLLMATFGALLPRQARASFDRWRATCADHLVSALPCGSPPSSSQ